MRGTFDVDFMIAVTFFMAVYASLYLSLPTLVSTFRVNADPLLAETIFLSDVLVSTAGNPANWSEGGGGFNETVSLLPPNPCVIRWGGNGSTSSCNTTLFAPEAIYHGMTSQDNMTLHFPVVNGQRNNSYLWLRACSLVGASKTGIWIMIGGILTRVDQWNVPNCGGMPYNFHDNYFNLSDYLPDSNGEYNITINGSTALYDYAALNTSTLNVIENSGFAYFNVTNRPCILDRIKVLAMQNRSCEELEGVSDILFNFKVTVSTYKENITCNTTLTTMGPRLVERACYLRENATVYTPARVKVWAW